MHTALACDLDRELQASRHSLFGKVLGVFAVAVIVAGGGMNRIAWLIVLCGGFLALTARGDDALPATRIIIGTNPSVVERFAATELQSYLAQTTGGDKLPISTGEAAPLVASSCDIFLGRPQNDPQIAKLCHDAGLQVDSETLGEDGYVLKTVPFGSGTALLLTGPQERSCLFAAYHFLETCGARFFGYHGRDGELVPHRPQLTVGNLDIREKPRMKYRFISDNGFDTGDREKLLRVADWGAKNRCNIMMVTPSRAGESWRQVPIEALKQRGLLIAGPGHALAQLTPKPELFSTHPEYFPLIKGQRKATYSKDWGGCTSFCYANATAMRMVVDNAVKYVDANPFIDVLAIYPPDGSQRGSQCQCEACAKRSTADWYLTTLNNIAQAIVPRRPNLKLMWLSYNECGPPPKQALPWNQGRNFMLVWCNDIRNLHEPMDSLANRRAAPYLQWKTNLRQIKTDWLPNPTDQDLAATHRWHKWFEFLQGHQYAGDVVLLEYYNAHVAKSLKLPWLGYCQSGPWPDNLMQRDFQFYCAQGITGWQNCTDYYNDHPNPYWNRMMAQMLWNPWADVAAITRDFYTQYYGPAGAAAQNYFTALWQELANETVAADGMQRLQALETLLVEAEVSGKQKADAEVMARLKAVREFHEHCIKIRKALPADYRPDGTPKKQ